jgi:hypothetical protein
MSFSTPGGTSAAGDVYDAGTADEADDTGGGADGAGAAVDAEEAGATAEADSAGAGRTWT